MVSIVNRNHLCISNRVPGTTSTENFGTGVGVDPSDYESYSLAQVRDTLAIAGLSATQTDFNLITKESSGFLNDPFDGIVGTRITRYVFYNSYTPSALI